MAAHVMTVNVPVDMRIRFVDVYANDTSKNAGKGYGSQVAVKGPINGADEAKIYLKGFTDSNLAQLVNAGVIAPSNYADDPAEKYNIPVVGKDTVTLLLEQPAGQKHPKLKITGKNGTPPVASALLPNETGHEDYHEHHETGAPPSVKVNASVPIPHTGILLPEAPSFDALVTKYGECLDAVSELLHKRNMKLDPQAYTAAVATLFISRTQKNL